MKKKRNRDSVRLSTEGKYIVNRARIDKGWNKLQEDWYTKALTSEATLKRFWRGTPISRDIFIEMCKALDLKEWEELADWEDHDSTTVCFPLADNAPPEDLLPTLDLQYVKFKFMMTGIFAEDKRTEIEVVLAHLKDLLRDGCTITILPNKKSVAVTGTFTEEVNEQVDIALIHLEKLLTNYRLTKLPISESAL